MIEPGVLDVDVVADVRGRTRVRHLRQAYPQRVTTPLCVDVDPRIAYLCVQNPSGGIFADDSLYTTVAAGPGSHLLFTTQAATQVFDGHDGPGATHHQRIRVADRSVVEFVPREIIPQADSRFAQDTEIDVRGSGLFVGWEMLASGRIGRGERFRYRSLVCRTTVRVDGEVVARDALRLRRHEGRVDGAGSLPGRLIGADYCATLLVVAPTRSTGALQNALRSAFDALDVVSGISALQAESGLIVRVLGTRAPAMHEALAECLAAIRSELLILAPPPRRLI